MTKTKKVGTWFLSLVMGFSAIGTLAPTTVNAASEFRGQLTKVDSVSTDGNIVEISFNDSAVEGRITFLEDGIFRYNVDPTGKFEEYAKPNSTSHTATIQAQSDDSDKYSHPDATVKEVDGTYEISTDAVTIVLDKATAKMSIKNKAGNVVMSENAALTINSATVQSLNTNANEYYFGGGTQNGRFTHKGKTISIAPGGWTDGGVASPNPFYWSSTGYGVLRNTFKPGSYNFADGSENVTTTHNEAEFDAYYFVSNDTGIADKAETLLQEYYDVTGNPALLPEYAYYLAHLNCYNRDSWSGPVDKGGWLLEDGQRYQEGGQSEGYRIPEGADAETLNNEAPSVEADQFKGNVDEDTYKFSAQAVIDGHVDNDMPLGWFLPNDGYGCGYGQNGYYEKRTEEEKKNNDWSRADAAIDKNVENLKKFTEYAEKYGVRSGLWTQAALTPEDSERDSHYQGFQTLRDFQKEVTDGGVSALKTDVAWVGQGYSMALNSVKDGYNILSTSGKRPALVSLYGWGGFQRYASIWSGDQTGGNWEYIRFHIPTYIGQSLSGNPNIGSDVDGIFGGSDLITTRDLQFKTFTQTMLDMDGWGSIPKKPYNHGDPYTSINRMYLKLKAQLMPYLYTYGHEAVDGLPAIRAMFLEEPNAYTFGTATQYQFMYGDNFLVAPVYQNTNMQDNGNDIRNNIYLPGTSDIWVDYFTGDQYAGGQTINNFDAPLWKLPLFVKNGSIIPMYENHNNPMAITDTNKMGLDKTRRIVEFYPYETSSFDLIEDDGITLKGDNEDGTRNYGGKVTTHMSSVVKDGTATLTIDASKGNYDGYNANRHSTFVVNVSEKPSELVAKNGDTPVELTEVNSYAEFEEKAAANEAVWFYDESPNLNKYAMEGEEFKETEIKTTPKVYVSFTETNVSENAQTLVVKGFVNDGKLPADKENADLATPANLKAPEEMKTPTSIHLTWEPVEGATSYEILVDGVINSVGDETSYDHVDLTYNSEHTYQVRARNAEGYSKWSEPALTTRSLLDPWRNTPDPVDIHWTGKVWGSHDPELAFDKELQNGDGGFHSNNGGINETLTVDYGKGYNIETIEYYPRDDNNGNANGTVTKMEFATSLDGVHWSETRVFNWEVNTEAKIIDNVGSARYLRFIPRESVGTFFYASEIKVNATEGCKPFEIGSISIQNRDQVTETDYTNLINYKGVSSKDTPTFDKQVKEYGLDINMNDVYDVYDYAYTMFKLDGGTKKTGSVSGNALLLPSADKVNSGETFTIDVYLDDVTNLNAIGQVIDYKPNMVEFVSTTQSPAIKQMTDLTVNKTYDDGSAYLNLAYVNRGNQSTYKGSGIVATITMKAKSDITVADAVALNSVTLIGPDYSTVITDTAVEPEIPDVPTETTVEYKQSDFNITMTNDVLTEDDGSNVTKIVQSGKYDALFNGTNGREFEFKYYYGGDNDNLLPPEVKVPTTIHFALKTPSNMSSILVRNSDGATIASNGYVKKLNAIVTYEDNSKKEFTFDQAESVFEIKVDTTKKVKNIDITPLETSGRAVPTTGDPVNKPVDNRMLTLGEIDFLYTTGVPVESIAPAEDNVKEVYVGYMEDVNAVISPSNCPNKFFKAESLNPDIASIIILPDQNGNPIYKVRGIKEGTATIKLTAAGDETKTATYEVTVKAGVNKAELEKAINNYKDLSPEIYTEDSYKVYKNALDNAMKVYADKDATRSEVDNATAELNNAVADLVVIPADESRVLPQSIVIDAEALNSSGAEAMNMFDGNLETYWETPWSGDDAFLPKDVVISLDKPYLLEQVTFTSHQIINGGVTDYEVYVRNGDGEWIKVTAGHVDGSNYGNGNFTVNARFNTITADAVKFVVTGAEGRIDSEDNMYARVAEMKFYGQAITDKTALQEKVDEVKDTEKGNFTDASWNAFVEALDHAEAVLAEPYPTEEEVESALADLTEAFDGLTENVDTSTLEDLVNANKDKVQSDYTAESWKAFEQALKAAQAVLEKENPTQAEVNKALTDLQNAIDGLRKSETIVPTDPTNPDGNGSDSGTPNTGDSTNALGLMFLLMLSAGAFVIAKSKKRC